MDEQEKAFLIAAIRIKLKKDKQEAKKAEKAQKLNRRSHSHRRRR